MSDQQTIRETINELYKFSGIQHRYDGEVNQSTAAVLGDILRRIRSCSDSMSWVPRPTGSPSISWVAKNLGKSFINDIKNKTSKTCVKTVMLKSRTRLDMAGMGL